MQKNSDKNKNDLNGSDILKTLIETLKKINLSHKSKLGKRQTELFFNHMPIIFWNNKSMKELLGPYSLAASIVAAKKFKLYKENIAKHKSYPALGLNDGTKDNCQGAKCQKSQITAQPVLERMYDFLVPKKLKNSDLKTLSDQEVAVSLAQAIREGIITLDDIRNYFDACAERMTYMIELIIYEMIFGNLNLKHKTSAKNMLSMENFEQKLKRAYFSELSDEQLSNGLYIAAVGHNITLKDLRDYFNDDMARVIGLTICKIVLKNLDIGYESNGERMLKFFKDLGSWVTDYVFESYMERVTEDHCCEHTRELLGEDYGFMFSYPADEKYKKYKKENPDFINWIKSAISKALAGEKIENKIVEEYNIKPMYLAKYLSMLEDDKFIYDSKSFAALHYDSKDLGADPFMEGIDEFRYGYFYESYLNNNAYISKCDKEELSILFLVVLAIGAFGLETRDVYAIDSFEREYFGSFLKNFNPTQEQLANAFSLLFRQEEEWIMVYSRHCYDAFILGMNKLTKRFFVPMISAMMSETTDIITMEDNLYGCLTGHDFFRDFDCGNEEDFVDSMWDGDQTKLKMKSESVVFDAEKVELALETIDKLSDIQKLITIVALVGYRFRDCHSNESRIISNETMEKRFKSCFSQAFDNCIDKIAEIYKTDKNNNKSYLIYRIMRDREVFGLTKNQLKRLLNEALKLGDDKFVCTDNFDDNLEIKDKFYELVQKLRAELGHEALEDEHKDKNIEDKKEKDKKEDSDTQEKDLDIKLGSNKKPEPRQQDDFINKKRNRDNKDK